VRSAVEQRFSASRGARVGLAILAILGLLAAWAPFLASDVPFVLVARDLGTLERARSELVPLAESYERAAREDQAVSRLFADVAALESRIDRLAPAASARDFTALRAALAKTRESNVDRVAVAAELVAAARLTRDALGPGRLVAPRERTFPLLTRLDGFDVLVALAPIGVALALRLRRKLRTTRAVVFAFAPILAVSAVVGVLHVEPRLSAQGSLKRAIARVDVEVESAVFAPIPFGFAETNLSESWRPPTWLSSARVDVDGRSTSASRAYGPSAGRIEANPFEPAIDALHRHVLGTDALGRDIAARVLWGGRRSLAIGAAAAVLLFAIGSVLGVAAGFLGGFVDVVVSRTIEVVLCFPAFFLVLVAVAWTDPDVVPMSLAVVLVIAAVGWTTTARLVRAEALRVAASGHVLAARALGVARVEILFRHVLPNAVGPAIVAFGFAAGGAIGVESSLAFLGLGVDVAFPSWGGLVGSARGADRSWAWIAPGIAVFLAVLAWVLVAEAARAALEPRRAIRSAP